MADKRLDFLLDFFPTAEESVPVAMYQRSIAKLLSDVLEFILCVLVQLIHQFAKNKSTRRLTSTLGSRSNPAR